MTGSDEQSLLEQQLKSIYNSTNQQPPLILDTRSQQQYEQRRLAGAVNIPLDTLTPRCFLLPDKHVPFAVVLPPAGSFSVTTDPQQHGSVVVEEGPAQQVAVFLKGASSLPDFLSSRGWTSVTCYLQDSPELWEVAAQLSVLEQGLPGDPQQQLARRCLFAPSGLLAANITRCEASLLEQQQQQQQQPGSKGRVLHALDLGCGSGRDVAWLASRQPALPDPEKHQQPQQQQQQQPHWHVTGVDEWRGALERAADLTEALQLGPEHVQLLFAKICTTTGSIQQLQVPAKSRLCGSPLLAAPAAELDQQQADSSDCLGSGRRFDLIMCCRFLVRALLPHLHALLNPGGFLLYCTFLDSPGTRAFGRPSGPDHLLQPGELAAQHFGPAQGFAVLQDDVVTTPDGREVCWFVARKDLS